MLTELLLQWLDDIAIWEINAISSLEFVKYLLFIVDASELITYLYEASILREMSRSGI